MYFNVRARSWTKSFLECMLTIVNEFFLRNCPNIKRIRLLRQQNYRLYVLTMYNLVHAIFRVYFTLLFLLFYSVF